MYFMQFIGYFLKINLSFIFDILRYIILKTEKMSCILQFILGNLDFSHYPRNTLLIKKHNLCS